MRRLPAVDAQPGMVLARPLTDAFQNMILKEQQVLTEDVIIRLPVYGVDELFIDDERAAEVSAEPLVEPYAEAQITQGLQTLYNECRVSGVLDDAILDLIIRPIHEMADDFFPVGFAELNTAPCTSRADHLFRLPARASGMAMLLAAISGMSEDQAVDVGLATALMNIGLVNLPREIVESIDPLAPAQEHELKKHPVHGYVLLKDSQRIPSAISNAVLQSHELVDGSGYPLGLKRDEISRMARIVTIADTYFTLISPFNRAEQNSRHGALEYLMAYGGETFDREFVQLLIHSVPAYPSGVLLSLTSGEMGVVTEPNPGRIGRPRVKILADKDGFELDARYRVELDLSDPRNRQRAVVEHRAA